MSKAARLVVSRPASTASSDSKSHELISIALFSGIGLLITFVAILFGVQGAWF
jgi:hypothetical protein